MRSAKVLWFNQSLGYGFIEDNESGAELFFHWTSIVSDEYYKTVCDGTYVNYECADNGKVTSVTPLKRISHRGKPILVVSFMKLECGSTISNLNFDIIRKASYGVKYIATHKDFIFGFSEIVSEKYIEVIFETINNNPMHDKNYVKKVLYTDELPHDIMIV